MKLIDRLRLRLAKEKAAAEQQPIDNKISIDMMTNKALKRRTTSSLFSGNINTLEQ
jgi:hypothetical protein